MYFEESSHPHPLIRLLNIILNITSHFFSNSCIQKEELELDAITLFMSIIDFHKELEDGKIFTTGFSNLIPQYTENIERIKLYTSKILTLEDSNEYTDAMSIWNENINNLN